MALLLASCTVGAAAVSASKFQRGFSQNARMAFAKLVGDSRGSDVLVRSVQLMGHETHGGITLFRLRLTGCSGDEVPRQWEVFRRYDDFVQLRRRLAVRRRRAGGAFPGKTWLLPCSGGRLAERRRLLQGWLQGVLTEFQTGGDAQHAFIARQRAQKLQILHEFLGLDCNGLLRHCSRPVLEALQPAPWTSNIQPMASQALYFGSPAPEQDAHNQEEEVATRQQRPRGDDPTSQALYFGSQTLHMCPSAPNEEAQATHQQRTLEESAAREGWGWQACTCPAVAAC